MLEDLRGWPLVILIVVVVVLFGAKRLPDAARGLGRSLRVFKSEVKSMQDEDAPSAAATPQIQQTSAPAPAPTVQQTQPEQPQA